MKAQYMAETVAAERLGAIEEHHKPPVTVSGVETAHLLDIFYRVIATRTQRRDAAALEIQYYYYLIRHVT